MDNLLDDFPNSWNPFHFHQNLSNGFNEFVNPSNGFKVNREFVDPISIPENHQHLSNSSSSSFSSFSSSSSTSPNSEGDSPDSHDTSNSMLKYISEMLMDEEDLQTKPCMLLDCLALQAAEKSLYDVLGQKYPPSLSDNSASVISQNGDGSGNEFAQNSSIDSGNCSFSVSSDWVSGNGGSEVFPRNSSVLDPVLAQDSSFQMQSIGLFRKGVEEASKFLPKPEFEIIDLEFNPEKLGGGDVLSGLREKRNHNREDNEDSPEEMRITKQSAIFADDNALSELFDEVLLCRGESRRPQSCGSDESSENETNKKSQIKTKSQRSKGKKKNGAKKQENKVEVVDLWSLLTQCSHAVSNYDKRTATELLNQIRQHSSALGDGTQRLAHYFSKGLETRLAAGTPLYMPFVSNETSAAEILKAYQVFIKACPFRRMANFYANRTILKQAEKATRVHIIDFGILYGMQWPCLIQRLAQRPGGPPKLRITGIELPQPGFRPAERVEQTGRRLEHYCKRFEVPFEYKVLAQKWETVRYEDLKIDQDELTIVNCMFRMKYVPDETVVANSPRDRVLKLIRRINPDLFIHGVINGTYNTPFFTTRFKESLFYYSAFFDMYESSVPQESPERHLCEKEIWGRDILNVVACEGLERVERPETCKQWQVRNTRAGFKQIPLDQNLLKNVKNIVKSEYHQDFVIDWEGAWMLQGWKGRIIEGLSCWIPA